MQTTPRATESELYFDAVVSNYAITSPVGNNFTAVQGGWTNGLHHPNHMEKNMPAGWNVLCCDGHVEWRPFSPFTAIVMPGPNTASSSAGSGKVFWMP
jgi:hypothetical protein